MKNKQANKQKHLQMFALGLLFFGLLLFLGGWAV